MQNIFITFGQKSAAMSIYNKALSFSWKS